MQRHLRATIAVVVLAALAAACGPRFDEADVATSGTAAPGEASTTGTGDTVAPGEASGTAGTGGDTGRPGDPSTGDGTATGSGATATGGGASGSTAGQSAGATATGGSTTGGGAVEPGPAPGVTATSLKIGYLLPLTGAAPVPSNFDKGARVYWNYVNAQGGIFGRKVQVVIEDTQSSASVGKDKAKKLIEQDKVFAVVVLDRLENQQAIGAYLDGRQVPNIQIQAPANLAASQTWTFGVTIDHAVQGRLVADYFVKVLKATKAAIVRENTPSLAPGADAFARQMRALGGQVVYSKEIDGQANDFSSESLALRQSGATATWLYMAPTPAAKLVNQADAAGYHPTWFANSISWGFDLTFKVAPKALAGARAFSPWLPLTDPRTNTYQQEYRKQYNETPDDLGVVGWGVGQIVAEGLRKSGKDLGQNGFRHAMQNLNFRPDLWAPLAFSNGVRQGANVVAVLKESGGRWALERDFTGSF